MLEQILIKGVFALRTAALAKSASRVSGLGNSGVISPASSVSRRRLVQLEDIFES
jgi:hypothetical protein